MKQPIATYFGIPIYADETVPKDTAYLVSLRSPKEATRLSEILGGDFRVLDSVKIIGLGGDDGI